MNRGDAQIISLTITISGEPITEGYADEIELTINPDSSQNCVKKKLTTGDIVWNGMISKYTTLLSQADTFKMLSGANTYQLRIKKGEEVVSSVIGSLKFGNANSSEILTNGTSESEHTDPVG